MPQRGKEKRQAMTALSRGCVEKQWGRLGRVEC